MEHLPHLHVILLRLVSIPERVWGGLERYTESRLFWDSLVSIPERVWGGLEHNWAVTLVVVV